MMERYTPGRVPDKNSPDAFAQIWAELRRIAAVLSQLERLNLPTLYAEPPKPKEGDICKADGTHWDPGSGAGEYIYSAGAWHKFTRS